MTRALRDARAVPAWWLPLLAALLPFAVSHLAWALSLHAQLIEACNPYLDGCVSISRAARHGAGNHLFRLVMLPIAALQALCWWSAARWLALRYAREARALPWLGIAAGAFLALYANFLGTEGGIYPLLRRYGVTGYFGCTYLALLTLLSGLSRASPRPRAYRPLLVVALGFMAVGLAAVASGLLADEALRDRAENVLEWHLGLWLTAMFAVLAWHWRRERLRWRLEQPQAPADP